MNIGLLFGSFNPIHKGHLSIGRHLLTHTVLEQIWLVLSPHNPFKDKSTLVDFDHRYHMAQMATSLDRDISVCTIEQELSKPSYTIQTLDLLKQTYPEHNFSMIMGYDNLTGLHKWKDAQKIINNFTIYVYPRSTNTSNKPITVEPSNITFIKDAPIVDISATEIRNDIRYKGRSKHLSKELQNYIKQHQLYQ